MRYVVAASLAAGLGLVGVSCGDGRPLEAGDPPPGASTTTTASAAATAALINTQALLDRYGFERCSEFPPAGEVTAERGQEILFAAVDAGIAVGGSPGSDGSRAIVLLYVLDEPSLKALAGIAQPAEVCVNGQDPNDYVTPGPRRWRDPAGGGSEPVPT